MRSVPEGWVTLSRPEAMMGKRPLLQVWLPKDRRERLSCDPPRESARRRRSGLRRRRAFARRKLTRYMLDLLAAYGDG